MLSSPLVPSTIRGSVRASRGATDSYRPSGVAFVIYVIPAFLPVTWAVLAIFYVHYKLPLLLFPVGGPVFSSLGRFVLGLGARKWGRTLVPAVPGLPERLQRWQYAWLFGGNA